MVYVEHPLRDGWVLSDDTQKPEGKSARYYRFRIALAPHEKVELPVTERRALMDTYALHNFSRPDLELFISRRYIDAATRTILEKIIDLKTQMATTSSRIEAIDGEVEEIGEDQQRLRDNIKALTATAEARQLISRYVAKADSQETRLEQLNKEKQEFNGNLSRLQQELQGVVQIPDARSEADELELLANRKRRPLARAAFRVCRPRRSTLPNGRVSAACGDYRFRVMCTLKAPLLSL